ncbi:hypothetical protein ACQB60_31525 [Actinomycetota bacterium Odt1-20B]
MVDGAMGIGTLTAIAAWTRRGPKAASGRTAMRCDDERGQRQFSFDRGGQRPRGVHV